MNGFTADAVRLNTELKRPPIDKATQALAWTRVFEFLKTTIQA